MASSASQGGTTQNDQACSSADHLNLKEHQGTLLCKYLLPASSKSRVAALGHWREGRDTPALGARGACHA